MAKHQPKVNRSEDQSQAGQSGHMTESSPNPHSEMTVAEMPVRTDQAQETGKQNVAQTPSTQDGVLHPSVAEGTEGGVADHDSMFNNADPQARAISSSGVVNARRDEARREHDKEKKSA
jgi:hypothetical protein